MEENDFTGMTDEQVDERLAEIAAELQDFDDSDVTADSLAHLESLANEAEGLRTESAARGEARAETSARMTDALARARGPQADAEVDAELEDEDADPDGEGEDADDEVDAAPVPIAASARKPSAGALVGRRPAAVKPKVERKTFLAATGHAVNVPEGRALADPLDLAKAIVAKQKTFARGISAGVRDFVSIGMGMKDIPEGFQVGGDAEKNFSVFQKAQVGQEALVASGGICAPQTPLYDFFRLAEAQNTIEDFLPTDGAPRGGIKFIQPPDFRAAAGGIALTTALEDAAGYVLNGGPTPNKPCITVVCPDTEEVLVTAISQCVTFGNLQYRTFPEQVEAFLEDLAVMFSITKETHYWTAMVNASTLVDSAIPYGASRGLLWDWTTAAVQYRKRHAMKRGATLDVVADDWALDVIKLDMAMDAYEGLDYFQVTDAQVMAFLRAQGLNVAWHNDLATAAGSIAASQPATVLNPWPNEVNAVIYAPGTFVRLDGGTLDVGLVRDSTLNQTNDLQLFMEEWAEVAMLGIESVHLVSTVCPNGTAPEPVVPLVCSGGSSS